MGKVVMKNLPMSQRGRSLELWENVSCSEESGERWPLFWKWRRTDVGSNAAAIVSVQPPSEASRGEAQPAAEQGDQGLHLRQADAGSSETTRLTPMNPA